ncbi:MAG: hypothetical protein ACREXT_17015, partial [Gammaproteobacteria bacterium]
MKYLIDVGASQARLRLKMPCAVGLAVGVCLAPSAFAAEGFAIGGIPLEFLLFAATLFGVAIFHRHTLAVGLGGLAAITGYKMFVTGFRAGPGWAGLAAHFHHEWVTLANLFFLLTGFAVLARHFEKSHIPVILPKYFPDDWKGAFLALVM